MKDRCGQELKVGQLVEVHPYQVLSAYVAEIKESPIAVPGGRTMPPQVLLQIMLPLLPDQEGVVDCYKVHDGKAPKPLLEDMKSAGSGSM